MLYAPSRPELGGRVDEGTDLSLYVSTWRPPTDVRIMAACVRAATGFRAGAGCAHQ